MRPFTAPLAASVLVLSALQAQAAECVLKPPRFNLASDTVHWEAAVPAGKDCLQGLRFASMVISLVFAASQPKNGSVVIQGPSFRYRPNPNFKGADNFSLSVNGAVGQIPGNSIIEVEVTVR